MKKLMFSLLAATGVMLAGCFETVEEVTINSDGTGTYSTTNDLSAIVALAKNMGGDDADKMDDTKVDTTISMAQFADSNKIALSEEEKMMVRGGQMKMNIDMKSEKVIIAMNFPFKSTSDISKYAKLSSKLMGETMKKQLSAGGTDEGQLKDMPEQSSMESYYDITYKNDQIKKKLNKDKYAGLASDEFLKGMQEAAQMGLPITSTQVFNLPRPAKKVEGKNVKLSDDRKKVTVKSTLDEFFSNGESLEFEVEF